MEGPKICRCVCVCVYYMYIYIYTYTDAYREGGRGRERETERQRERERERDRDRERERERDRHRCRQLGGRTCWHHLLEIQSHALNVYAVGVSTITNMMVSLWSQIPTASIPIQYYLPEDTAT